jgi:hypothetical protein
MRQRQSLTPCKSGMGEKEKINLLSYKYTHSFRQLPHLCLSVCGRESCSVKGFGTRDAGRVRDREDADEWGTIICDRRSLMEWTQRDGLLMTVRNDAVKGMPPCSGGFALSSHHTHNATRMKRGSDWLPLLQDTRTSTFAFSCRVPVYVFACVTRLQSQDCDLGTDLYSEMSLCSKVLLFIHSPTQTHASVSDSRPANCLMQ